MYQPKEIICEPSDRYRIPYKCYPEAWSESHGKYHPDYQIYKVCYRKHFHITCTAQQTIDCILKPIRQKNHPMNIR
jgi:hypothetical protein